MDGYEMYGGSLESILAITLAFAGITLMLSLAMRILDAIARWKINTKAGYKGWYALIPCLSEYTMFELATGFGWLGIVYFAIDVFGLGNSINTFSRLSAGSMNASGGAFTTILSIAEFIIGIYLAVKLARAFGKGMGFTIFLFFLGPIARMVLGFGSSRYLGVDGEGMNGYGNTAEQEVYQASAQSDPPPQNTDGTGSNPDAFAGTGTPPPAPQIHFCKKCGKEAVPGARFCEECGAPLSP